MHAYRRRSCSTSTGAWSDDDELVSINSGGALEKFESSFVFEAEASTPGGLPLRRSPRKLKRPANPVARALLRVDASGERRPVPSPPVPVRLRGSDSESLLLRTAAAAVAAACSAPLPPLSASLAAVAVRKYDLLFARCKPPPRPLPALLVASGCVALPPLSSASAASALRSSAAFRTTPIKSVKKRLE